MSARDAAVEHVAATLITRAWLLTRLLLRDTDGELSRAEGSAMATLEAGPRRITELAETEALAQPTVTQLVRRLHARGYVARTRPPEDGRVVLVSLTDEGRARLEALRATLQDTLRCALEHLPDADVRALADATDALDDLVDALARPSGQAAAGS
jgi:DNA-binding MarR family transcriptional regulator